MKTMMFLLLGALLFSGCGDLLPSNLIVEESGQTEYFVQNETEFELQLSFRRHGAETPDVVHVAPNAIERFAFDDGFGINPRPSDTFAAVEVVAFDQGAEVAFFEQAPIRDDGEWIGGRVDETYYGLSEWFLTIKNSTLAR